MAKHYLRLTPRELGAVRKKLSAGGDIELDDRNNRNGTRLHHAVRALDLPLVKMLVCDFGANARVRNWAGDEPLHWLADSLSFGANIVPNAKSKSKSKRKSESNSGHAVDEQNSESESDVDVESDPASSSKDASMLGVVLEIIRELVAAGADLEATNDTGDTSLSVIYCRPQHSPIAVAALIIAGAIPAPPLRQYGFGVPDFVVRLAKEEPSDANDSGRIRGGAAHRQVVASFLNPKEGEHVDVNAKDVHGNTLLNRAAWYGSPSAVKALVEAGADPNVAGREGYYPIHFTPHLISWRRRNELPLAGADQGMGDYYYFQVCKCLFIRGCLRFVNRCSRRQRPRCPPRARSCRRRYQRPERVRQDSTLFCRPDWFPRSCTLVTRIRG